VITRIQAAPLLVITPTVAFATNESSYKIGYEHGVSDAKIEKMNPTSHSLYIVQPGKNLPSHTQNFTWTNIAGYYSLQSCADKNSTDNPRYTTIMNHESQ